MFIKSSICGVLTLLSTTSAFALTCVNDYGGTASCASSSSKAGDCETLGFSKDDVSECGHFLYCPFDTAYKRCVTFDCSDYPLTSCPASAQSCSACGNGTEVSYKVNACIEGYALTDGKCTANACTDYPLTACPTGASSCSTCKSGTTTKYKVNGCKSGYTASGSTCVVASCPSGYSTSTTSCSSGYYLSTSGYSGSKPCRKCVANSCSGYSLSSCPTGGSCSYCLSGTTIKYKLNSCNSGYTKSGNTCVAATCSGYSLSSCPSGASSCSTCQSGSSTKYKVNGCKSGYTLSGSTCVAATCSGYTLSRCPSNGKCSSCKSGSSYKYKLNSCNSGYEKVGNKCVEVNTCSEDDGWVYVPTDVYKKATAQNSAHPECYSYGGYNFIKYGDTCESNGKTYYQDC